jgi:hypothetical protein
MKDCWTFLKLQEVVHKQEGKDTTEAHVMHPQQISKQQTEPCNGRISQIKETKMMEVISHLKGTSAQ